MDTGESYVTSYHPGTTNINEAQTVTTTLGQESTVQFSLTAARMSRVGGIVTDSTGKPAVGAMIILLPASGLSVAAFNTGQTGPDGAFTLSNVAPGDYQLSVQPIMQSGGDGRSEGASVPVSVGGADLLNLRVTTSRGATVAGRVVFEGDSPRTGVVPLRVFAQSGDPGRIVFNAGSPLANGVVADDGAFELAGGTGLVLFRVSAPPAWTLKSVSLEGGDITDTPTDLAGGLSGLTIVLTDKLTEVSGQVTDARGRALKDYAVVVQPSDPKPAPAMTRYLRVVRPDQDGRFRVRGLPPGAYEATAIESLEQGRQFVPDVQARLRDSSTPVHAARRRDAGARSEADPGLRVGIETAVFRPPWSRSRGRGLRGAGVQRHPQADADGGQHRDQPEDLLPTLRVHPVEARKDPHAADGQACTDRVQQKEVDE